jgi:DNA-binding IscR family transcriptional regulator
MLNQISVDAMAVFACIQQIADSRKRRPKTVNDVLGQLERHGLIRSVASLRSSRLGGTAR